MPEQVDFGPLCHYIYYEVIYSRKPDRVGLFVAQGFSPARPGRTCSARLQRCPTKSRAEALHYELCSSRAEALRYEKGS